MEIKNYTIVVDNSDKALNQRAKERCFKAITESGTNINNMEPVTREEALGQVIDGLGWRSFLENGGMGWHYFEGNVKNKRNELVGIAVIGPINPMNPRQGKVGAIGIKGGLITLGNF